MVLLCWRGAGAPVTPGVGTMSSFDEAPPPVLDMTRVIAYAIVDESVEWTGRQTLFVGGELLGPVPRLALGQDVTGDLKDTLVFHCNEKWEVLGVSGGATLEEAKARIERAYRGITAKWIDRGVSIEEARAWIYENSDHIICHFCGRRPGEFQQIAAGKLSAICNVCVDSLYADMHEPSVSARGHP